MVSRIYLVFSVTYPNQFIRKFEQFEYKSKTELINSSICLVTGHLRYFKNSIL